MMQQPVFHQEQAGSSQGQQQMVLCPVRLVYETQILVQPGDQIQPNQTILINPQNQPPWAQNRVQNQVIYVQNVPNNYMPQVQQHIDQNQMFLQQNYGFPQVIQHPMITQNQEQMRTTTLQVGNVPVNIQSPMQQNIAQLMPNDRIVHNYGHVQMNPGINVQNVQNQIANVPISGNNRQIQNVPKTISEMPNTQKPPEVQQNFRQLQLQNYRPQMTPQMNVRTPMPQTIAMIPMPNIVHKPEQTAQINTIQQTIPTSMQQINTNAQIEPRKALPVVQKVHTLPSTSVNHAPKNQGYSYRPIQPRPEQFRPNIPSPAITVQPNMNIQMQQNPNIIDVNRITAPVNTINYKVDTTNTQFNRKRKSESPDEIHRKLTIIPASQPATTSTSTMTVKRLENPIAQSISVTKVNTNEIGVNTNPIVKMNPKISTAPRNMIQINPIVDQNAKIKEELAKPILHSTPQIKIPITMTNTAVTTNSITQVEKDKLVRNTVFTQARFGRLLTDKDDIPVNINSIKDIKTDTEKDKMDIDVKTENITVNESKVETPKEKIEVKEEPRKTVEVKKEVPVQNTERNAEEKMLSDSMSRLKGNESNEIKFKNEKDYILTHVLDGFVIQESNVAFPIRLPLKEKTLAFNTAKEKANVKEDLEEANKEVKAEKVPDLSHLNLSENERLKESGEKTEEERTEENPFTDLKHCTVKAWTIEELATHLSKFNWADTISVLQEHEIDGESLFLVSKSQLVTIGVKENHADVICEFVKS